MHNSILFGLLFQISLPKHDSFIQIEQLNNAYKRTIKEISQPNQI